MKIYRIYEDFLGKLKPRAYAMTKEVAESYIRANIPSIVRVTRPDYIGTCDTIWNMNETQEKFPGFVPELTYHGKRSDNSNISLTFKEIDAIDA
jgi:hypothetical protein